MIVPVGTLRHAVVSVALAAACAATAAHGQVYKWVDANGITHYGEQPASEVVSRAKKLDIRTTGNDPAPLPGAPCYTIQCQYERMRDDRLVRDEEWRKDMEVRARLIAAEKDAPPSEAVATSPLIIGVPVVAGRRAPLHVHRPLAPRLPRTPEQPAEPRLRMRTR